MPSRRNTKRPPPCAESCAGLCSGDAWWLWNCLASPFVLIVNCLRYLLFPFFYVLLHRITRTIFCGCCRALCPSLIRYNDKKFPKGPESIIDMSEPPVGDNEFAGMDRSAIDSKVDWVRADTLLRERRVKQKREGARAVVGGMDDALNDHFQLFENGVSPSDIVQGGVGDCWLLAALASMAEHQESIMNCFFEFEYSYRGKYTVYMWDCGKHKWTSVTIDDSIPVKAGTLDPFFSNPRGTELWVFLLEKAFAKFVGGYAYLDGGHSAWAWHTLTGDNVFCYQRNNMLDWERHLYKFEASEKKNDQKHRMYKEDTHERVDVTRLFKLLKQFNSNRAVMGASIHSKLNSSLGLVGWHAYSLIEAKRTSSGHHLVQLRNPWGIKEWTGPWSDGSEEWTRHPSVAKELDHEETNDGTFWMELGDFVQYFDRIDICDRSTHRDFRLDVEEDMPCCGLCKGLVCGCSRFWCLCGGVRRIYCGHRTTNIVEYDPLCKCNKNIGKQWMDGESIV